METPVETLLNILLISHYFLPRHTAGTEIYTHRLGTALAARGHNVRVLAGEDDAGHYKPRIWEDDVNGLSVTFMGTGRTSKWVQWRKSLNDGYRPELESLFEEVLQHTRPDIVHIQHLATLSVSFIHIAKNRGIPVVVMLNDYWFLCQRIQLITSEGTRCQGFNPTRCAECLLAPYPLPIRILGKSAALAASEKRFQFLSDSLKSADLILSPSQHLIRVHEEHGIPKGTILHSDYGFPIPDNTSSWEPVSPLRVGYLGSLVPHKGVHILIDAVNELNGDAQLTIHGSPDSNPDYYRQLRTRNLDHVKFAGVSNPHDPYRTIVQYDVLVIPSLWEENSPLVIHEAHAAGRPVIASNVGGVPELIRDGVDGILVPPGDVNALSGAIAGLAANPDNLVAMGKQAKLPKPIDQHAKEIEGYYLNLLS